MGEVPFVSYAQAETEAEKFLSEYWPEKTVPVPIEPIVEHRLGVEIEIARGLFKDTGISGFLTNDMRTIYVDEFMWENFESRYRFTLAHEVAHLRLHARFYKRARVRSKSELVAFRQALLASDVARLEIQAMNFAGAVLMPRRPLAQEVAKCKREASEIVSAGMISSSKFWKSVASRIAKTFNVSTEAAQKRLDLAGLTNR
jgi:uncharacterized protein DUF955